MKETGGSGLIVNVKPHAVCFYMHIYINVHYSPLLWELLCEWRLHEQLSLSRWSSNPSRWTESDSLLKTKGKKKKNTNYILFLLFIWSVFSFFPPTLWLRPGVCHNGFLCIKYSAAPLYYENQMLLKPPRKAGCPGVILGKLLLEAGFLLICGEEQGARAKICIKHVSLWQMLLYTYCLLCLDNIMAVCYGLYKHFYIHLCKRFFKE